MLTKADKATLYAEIEKLQNKSAQFHIQLLNAIERSATIHETRRIERDYDNLRERIDQTFAIIALLDATHGGCEATQVNASKVLTNRAIAD